MHTEKRDDGRTNPHSFAFLRHFRHEKGVTVARMVTERRRDGESDGETEKATERRRDEESDEERRAESGR